MTATVPARQLAAIVADTVQGRQLQAIINPRVNQMRADVVAARNAIAEIDRLIHPALIALETRNDGWPTRNGEGGGSGGISDPVGSAATSRAASDLIELDAQIRMTWTLTMAGAVTIANMLRIMANSAPQQTVADKPALCQASLQYDGYEDWCRRDSKGAPMRCDDIVHAAGLCAQCYGRQWRWKRAKKAS